MGFLAKEFFVTKKKEKQREGKGFAVQISLANNEWRNYLFRHTLH